MRDEATQQIGSLKKLLGLLAKAADFFSRHQGFPVVPDNMKSQEFRDEFVHYPNKQARKIQDARTALLNTGLDVPDRWLTVPVNGPLSITAGKPFGRFSLAGVDPSEIVAVCKEIEAKIVRLEAGCDTRDSLLTETEQNVYEVIHQRGPVQGPEIVRIVGIEQSTLTRHIIPALKRKRGVKSKRSRGYYIDGQT